MSEKYISASKLKAHYSWLGKDATLSPKDIDDIIDAQPAADVEPVVRCGNCLYAMRMSDKTLQCAIHDIEISSKFYCADGKARDYVERSGSGE